MCGDMPCISLFSAVVDSRALLKIVRFKSQYFLTAFLLDAVTDGLP